jgi:hypothetical protein
VPGPAGKLYLIEARWSRTVTPTEAAPLQRLGSAAGTSRIEAILVHRASRTGPGFQAVAPGVRALTVEEFLAGFPGP